MAILRTELVSEDADGGVSRVSSLQVLAVSPLLAAFAGTLIVVGGWTIGAAPFWTVPDLTLSEAVLTKDAGEVVRLIEREQMDPNQRWPVRPELLSSPSAVTPLEAAVLIRRSEMIELLVRHGAVLAEGAARDALICQAVRVGGDDVVERLLVTGEKTDPRGRCASVASFQ